MASVAFIERILISSGKLFLVAGVSVDKAMRIVGQYIIDYFMTNYYGLGFATKCNYNNSPAIKIKYKNQPMKYILFAGGYNANSQDFIQGSTFNGVYLTEINLLNIDFIQQCLQRIISFKDAFIYGTLNPKSPKDPFYTSFLFRWWNEQQEDLNKHWLNYNKFYLEDNPILTPEMIEDAKRGYDPESLKYKRDILCQRVDAEGAIYRLHDFNYIVKLNERYLRYIVVADFGETVSATYFGAYAIERINGRNELHCLKEYHHLNKSGGEIGFKFSEDYCNDYAEFINECVSQFGSYPQNILYDGGSEIFYKLKTSLIKKHISIIPKYVIKDDCENRIQIVQNALINGSLKIYNKCNILIDDLKTAVYDEKKYELSGKFQRLENYNDLGHGDSLDALEYAMTWLHKSMNQ